MPNGRKQKNKATSQKQTIWKDSVNRGGLGEAHWDNRSGTQLYTIV